MKVIRSAQVPAEPVGGMLFPHGEVTRQPIVGASDSPELNFTLLNFAAGAKNAFHIHSADQVLVVTAGSGIVATEHAEHCIAVGDVVLIPAGEVHWHAGAADAAISFLSITPQGTATQVTAIKVAVG